MKIICIVSPVNGIITDIGNDHITIYINRTDNHDIYSPISGVLTNILNYKGSWTRHIFHAEENKIARTTLFIKNPDMDQMISFWLEVGKPKYVTDRILINKNIGDYLIRGEYIGEIILGSLAELHFNGLKFYKMVGTNSCVHAGKTILACAIVSANSETNEIVGNIISKMALA